MADGKAAWGRLRGAPPGTASGAAPGTPGPTPRDAGRFALVGAVTYALATLAVWAADRPGHPPSVSFMAVPFIRFVAIAWTTKLLGDLVYFAVSPRHREVAYLGDYLANDFVTYQRFGLPLAIVQSLALVQGYVPVSLQALWQGAGPATLLFLVNRWLVERAQERRRLARGGVPVVRRTAS